MTSRSPDAVRSPRASVGSEGLVRAIGRWTMVALMINMIVGSGIFGLPARIHAQVGAYGLLAYAACAVVIACITLCLAEVASRFPATGGPYLYTIAAFGPLPGFLVGWLMVITRMSSLAIIANVMADYLGYLSPLFSAGGPHLIVRVAALLALAAINVIGVRQGAGIAVAFTIAKLIPLLAFVGVGLFFVDRSRFVGPPPPSGAVTASVLQLVFAFGGFEAAVVTAGEMKDPPRDAPFALLVGIAAATLLYVAIQTVCIGTLPALASSKRPLADAAATFAGAVGGSLIAAGGVASAFGTLGGTMLAAPRVLFAMAEQRHLPAWLARPHPRFHTPWAAIVIVTAGGILLSVTGTFTYLLGLNVLTRLVQYLSTAIAVPVLRRRSPSTPAPFRVPGSIVVVPATIVACAWLIASSGAHELRDVAIALALGALLFAARAAMRRGGVDAPTAS